MMHKAFWAAISVFLLVAITGAGLRLRANASLTSVARPVVGSSLLAHSYEEGPD